jgi:uncharacterized lipoprotein YddW (UPF0748 family)
MRFAWLFVLAALLPGHLSPAAGEPSFATRAIWANPEAFASPEATRVMLDRCQAAKLNLVLANVMAYGSVSFKSPHFRGKVLANEQFDPLAYLVQQAHARGIKIQAWCCVYYEGARGTSKRLHHEAWLNRSLTGHPFEKDFISPAHPEANPYLLSVMKDLLAYDIDGIHLDYIRYPGAAFDYSDAARAGFKAVAGFDPGDFVDHAGRIVPQDSEPFPVRVLLPKIFGEKVWELTALERTLDHAGIGFAYVSESPANIARLTVPGWLIVSSYDSVPQPMALALSNYVARGGNILWTDPPGRSLAKSEVVRGLTGLESARWLGEQTISLHTTNPAAPAWPSEPFRCESVSRLRPGAAAILARGGDGEPLISLQRTGSGRVVVAGFQLMKSTSPVVAAVARDLRAWFARESGVTNTCDPLAAKRAQWVAWRGERVTGLVRELHDAMREKPGVVLSSSGGPSPAEFFGSFRDARRWLAEGLNEEVFPMNYTADPQALAEMLGLQARSAPPGTFDRIFPGLQIYSTRLAGGERITEAMDPALVERQLQVVARLGSKGFCLFAYNYLTDDIIAVVRKFSP